MQGVGYVAWNFGQAFFGRLFTLAKVMENSKMRIQSTTSFAVLLLSSAVATSALAAQPYTGCPAGYHRAEAEGGGVGSVNAQTRKAEGEGGGVGSVNAQTRKAEGEGGGVGSVNAQTRKAEGEGGGVGSVNAQTRKAEGEGGGVGSVNAATRKAEALAQMPCVEN